jgi:hypothetical protein
MNASILFYACSLFAAAAVNPFEGKKYILEEGFFNADSMVFVEGSLDKRGGIFDRFTFLSKGTLKHEIYNPSKVGFCGNGLLYMDTAVFKLNGNKMNIQAHGGYWTMSAFHFDIDYTWKMRGNKLILTKAKENYYEVDDPYLLLKD